MATKATTKVPTFPTSDDYASADRSGKARIRTDVTKVRDAAIRSGDWETVKASQDALDGFGPATAPKVEVDYAGFAANQIATLEAALSVLRSGTVHTTNGPDTIIESPELLLNGTVDSDMVTTLTTIKTRRSGKRDVGAFIASALVGTEGWVRVSEIARHTTDDFPGGESLGGRISAALNACLSGDRSIDGIIAGHDDDGRLCARLAS